MSFTLVPIIDSNDHFLETYRQLEERENSISHTTMPSFSEHVAFVKNNPYRNWFLIQENRKFVGNLYLHQDNSIGIQLPSSHMSLVPEILNYISSTWDPLPAIPSVRRGEFFINIPTANEALQKVLTDIGAAEVQRSFLMP